MTSSFCTHTRSQKSRKYLCKFICLFALFDLTVVSISYSLDLYVNYEEVIDAWCHGECRNMTDCVTLVNKTNVLVSRISFGAELSAESKNIIS